MRSFLYAFVAMAVLGSSFSAHAGCYGPVGRTDTLWLIALELRPEPSIIPQRMMLALLEANPDAFSSENVNDLNAGSILCFDASDPIGFNDRAAVAEVSRHNREWRSVRVPGSSGTVPGGVDASRTELPKSESEPPLQDGRGMSGSLDLGHGVAAFELRLAEMEAQLEALSSGGAGSPSAQDALFASTVGEHAATLERLLARLDRSEREIERLRSLVSNTGVQNELAALRSRVSALEAPAERSDASSDSAAPSDDVVALSRVVLRLDAEIARLALRVAHNEAQTMALVRLLEAESEAVGVVKSRLLRSLRLLSSAAFPEGEVEVPSNAGMPTPAPQSGGEGAMEPMPTPAPQSGGEGAMEPMPTPAPQSVGEGAMEPMPTPAPQSVGEGAMEPMPTPAPQSVGEGAMEPMPTPAPQSVGEGAMEPMPTPAPQSVGEGAMEPMPTPAPQSVGEGAMEPMPTPAPQTAESTPAEPSAPSEAAEEPSPAPESLISKGLDYVKIITEQASEWLERLKELW